MATADSRQVPGVLSFHDVGLGTGLKAEPGMTGIINVNGTMTNVTADGTQSALGGGLPGYTGLVDTTGVGNDSVPLQAKLTAQAALGGGTVVVGPGTHRLRSTVNVPSGVSILGSGRDATSFLVDDAFAGNIGDVFKLTNTYGVSLADFNIRATAPRTAGRAIYIIGGDPTRPLNGFNLSQNNTTVRRVDMNDQFDGLVAENNGAASNWLLRLGEGLWKNFHRNGDGVRINTPGAVSAYGASHFITDLFIALDTLAIAGSTGCGLRITSTGDATIKGLQVINTFNGMVCNPPTVTGRLSTLRFSECQFDTAQDACVNIVGTGAPVVGDLSFNHCWFAGSQTSHGLVSNMPLMGSLRVTNSFIYANNQYGIVLTGTVGGFRNAIIDSNHFSGNAVGGFRAVAAVNFGVCNNLFSNTEALGGVSGVQATAVTLDAGCDRIRVLGNDWQHNTAGLLDNSGAVTKAIANNIA